MAIEIKTSDSNAKQLILTSPDNSINITENTLTNETELTINKEVVEKKNINTSSNLDPTAYNNLGLLTENVTVTYEEEEEGKVYEYKGQFQVDAEGIYNIDFGNVQFSGDTEINNYSTYVFTIIGKYGTLKEYKFPGFFGKLIDSFSEVNSIKVKLNGTNVIIPVNNNGWFFKEINFELNEISFFTDDASKIKELYLNGLKGENLTSLKELCYDCINLAKIEFDKLNLSNVTSIEYAFYNCNSIKKIRLNKTLINLIKIRNLFAQCTNLENIENIENLETKNVADFSQIFDHCKKITNLILNWNTSKATSFYQTFLYCENLEELDLKQWNTSSSLSFNGTFYACKKLKFLHINLNIYSATALQTMFRDCQNLREIKIDGIGSNINNMSQMFMNCYYIEKLDLSNIKTTLLTNVSSLVYKCQNLREINLDNWILANNTNVSTMFTDVNNLSKIYLRNSDEITFNLISSVKPANATIVTA